MTRFSTLILSQKGNETINLIRRQKESVTLDLRNRGRGGYLLMRA